MALIITLLMLLLLSGMAATMLFSVNSDAMTNKYYGTFRASYYAADSGLNIARMAIYNQLTAAITAKNPPIPLGTETTVLSYINSTYGASNTYTSILGGAVAGSWPARFRIDPSSSTLTATCTPYSSYSSSSGTCSGSAGTCSSPVNPTCFVYAYNYNLMVYGQSSGTETTTLVESGVLNITVPLVSTQTTNFSNWGMFVANSNVCDGSYLVPGLFTGPVYTNGGFTYSDTGQYIFTDKVNTVSSKAGYQYTSGSCNGTCNQVGASSNKCGTTTIAPQFQGGLSLNAATATLPPNDYNQLRAVLDATGSAGTQVQNSDLHASLRNVSGSSYPSTGATSGVYLPYTSSQGVNTFTGGGIYVEGDANVTLSTSGAAQVYTITQNSTTTTVTINNATNTTSFSSGSNNVTISGVPKQLGAGGNPITYSNSLYPGDATMLYVHGNVNALQGPGQGQVAINDGTALSITASSNVTITGDILYKTKRVTLDNNDTYIPANDNGQALGIFTSNGNINLNNQQQNNNLEVDAVLAAISSSGTGGLTNTGNAINTLTIVGGRIQGQVMNINTTTRNIYFDKGYVQGSFGPPWFPSTTITYVDQGAPTPNPPVFQRLLWTNKTSTTQW